jgi:hypothetical protein
MERMLLHYIYRMCAQNAQFLDGYGAFLAEYGGRQEAIPVLQKACAACPEDGFEKFMYVLFHVFV